MPIKELQQRLTQVGVIRLGEQRLSKNNKPYPAKLDTFRITSPSKPLIEAVAELYGGEVRAWTEGPGGGQWQVTTGVTEMAVHVLPQKIDPNYELWGNGFRARLCDGETERIRNVPCFCAALQQQAEAQGRAWKRGPKDCKPTTRLSLMLSDVPSLGTFKLESHGWNAAAELPTLAVAILGQVNRPVPAVLRLEQREDRILNVSGAEEKVEPRKYAVPVLDFGQLATPRQALGAGMDAVVRTAVGGAPARQAIASSAAADEPPVDPRPELWARARADGADLAALRKVWEDAAAAAKSGFDDPELATFLRQRMQQLAAGQPSAPVSAPAGEVVDAEEEPDPDVIWQKILKTAAARGWNLPAVEERYRTRMGHDPSEETATGWKLAEFLTAVENGQVQ